MQYDLHVEDVSSIRRRLTFTVAPELVGKELDQAFNDMKNRMKLPGFRPGKVPRSVLEARFGRSVRGELAQKLVERTWRQAAPSFAVTSQPELVEQTELDPTQAFRFTINVEVRPSVELKGYKGLSVGYTAPVVTEADVDRLVNQRLQGKARLADITDRPVQVGDKVNTALTVEVDGAVVHDHPGTLINTSGERYYPGVEALLVGMGVGDSKSGEVAFGDKAGVNELVGVTGLVTASVKNIQAMVVPSLDDALATELGYEGGVDAMRAALRMQLEGQAHEAGRMQARVALLQKLVDGHDFEVPDGLVEEQLNALVEELRVRRAWGGTDPRSIRFSDAEMADLRSRARFAAKGAVLLSEVSKAESLGVTDADIDAKIREIADARGQAPEAIKGYLVRENAIPMLKDRILEEKTLEWLLENADLQVAAPVDDAAQAAPAEEVASTEG